jgi:hypothetical protein
MKKTVLTLFIMTSFIIVSAQNVTIQMAKKAAESFWSKSFDNNNKMARLQFCKTDQSDTLLYVYNFENSGFVVISGDYSCSPILAYSSEGSFKNDAAPACKAWLQNYSEQIAAKKKNKSLAINPEWNALFDLNQEANNKKTTKSVAPLITTKWDQGQYYNYMCPAYPTGPDGKCVTGCVATAMAQIMRYYNYPDQGLGSHSYSHPYFGNIYANFAATTYDWTNMGVYANNLNKAAIGTLIFHCGVSVDMDYSPNESGAQSENAALALQNFFHYRNTIESVNKHDYSEYDWIALLKENLDEQHPVLYSGSGSGGGHAWVCDGYDNNDRFHMNWGWSGSDNGYFMVSLLVAGGYDFTSYQSAIVNIMPYFAPYCLTSRTFTDSTRVISDGSGYSYYWNNTDCDWLIKPSGADRVKLQFTDFNTETTNDIVSVYDGETTSAPLLGIFSGTNAPPVLTANSGKMLITFASNSSTQGLGWTAKYWCLKQGDGIKENDNTTLNVYPNPATNDLIIVNDNSINEDVDISIYDYAGKEVYASAFSFEKGNNRKIDIGKLCAGLYFISLQTDKHIYRTKFVKQ